jgi:DNA-binding response OmpR family regulator
MAQPLVSKTREPIVVADDDRVVVTLVTEFLRKKGFTVFPAFDSMQAMLGARQHKPKVLILDIAMPGGSGMDVLKKLKMSNQTTQIPIIILTGSTDATMRDGALDLGAEEFLTKPVDLKALHAAILRALGRPPEPDEPATVPPAA